MQYLEITLDPNEACIAEAGAFMYMDPGIRMETIFGDGSGTQQGGLMGAVLGPRQARAGRRGAFHDPVPERRRRPPEGGLRLALSRQDRGHGSAPARRRD